MLYQEKLERNLDNFFAFATFWKQFYLFDPANVVDEGYYKKDILKPDEDVDNNGNKRLFVAHKDFAVAVLTTNNYKEEDLNEVFEKFGLNKLYF